MKLWRENPSEVVQIVVVGVVALIVVGLVVFALIDVWADPAVPMPLSTFSPTP